MEVDPDYSSTTKPRDTTLHVGDRSDDNVSLKAIFTEHGNTFSAQWINEELLFVQVWWGRFTSSDIILDVDNGKLLYNEVAKYAQLGEPCEGK